MVMNNKPAAQKPDFDIENIITRRVPKQNFKIHPENSTVSSSVPKLQAALASLQSS